MPRIYISVGSNIDRERHIDGAIAELHRRFAPLTLSPVYETQAVGFEGDDFYNLVVGLDSDMPVMELAELLDDIENRFGRDRSLPRFGPRTLDLDLLAYGDCVRHDEHIELPRNEITQYAFVLKPLADIAADELHPGLGRSYGELWSAFSDSSQPLKKIAWQAHSPGN